MGYIAVGGFYFTAFNSRERYHDSPYNGEVVMLSCPSLSFPIRVILFNHILTDICTTMELNMTTVVKILIGCNFFEGANNRCQLYF